MANSQPPPPSYRLLTLIWTGPHAEADRERFEERAAIMEYDGGLTRDRAEELAYEQVQRERNQRLIDEVNKKQ